jgi:hypothetical protein
MAIDIKKIEKLFSSRSSLDVFKEALFEILPEKKRWVSFVIFGVISAISAALIGVSKDTIDLFYKAISNLNNIILYLFAIVFTGYALFQALMNNDLLKRLLTTEGKSANSSKDPTSNNETGKSKLQESNEYFVKIMMLMVTAIVINSLLLLLVGSLPKDFFLPLSNAFNNALATIFIWVYFVYMILIIWEMKSFVFNMFQLFNAHAGSKAIELLKSQDEE